MLSGALCRVHRRVDSIVRRIPDSLLDTASPPTCASNPRCMRTPFYGRLSCATLYMYHSTTMLMLWFSFLISNNSKQSIFFFLRQYVGSAFSDIAPDTRNELNAQGQRLQQFIPKTNTPRRRVHEPRPRRVLLGDCRRRARNRTGTRKRIQQWNASRLQPQARLHARARSAPTPTTATAILKMPARLHT